MAGWKTHLKTKNALLILVLVGSEITVSQANAVHADQLRGKNVPRMEAHAHAMRSRRLLEKLVVPRKTFPFLSAQKPKSIYNGFPLMKGFSNYHVGHHASRKMQVLSMLQGAEGSSTLREILAHNHAGTAAYHNQIMNSASLFGLGLPEVVVIGLVALFIFGPGSLPTIGKQLGSTVRELKGAAAEFKDELDAVQNSSSTSEPQ
eukprot:gnl/MRDRNA2_/MRDRNA2_114211_c0_seq1.p1 gnl/MRDRNA2_/MRDRNA2_114211_c0~~gnl/MRDRNA2_/MRDRNA2_114211_c0_seq1.p1  ORF type:complete len:204 (-),score=38.75 gnl/MRDRNA2_/MRDRNA2_114211_c0_seq1:152-763(-)